VLRYGGTVLLVMVLANGLYGISLPLDLSSVSGFVVSTVVFIAYVWMMRTLFRLPFALRWGWVRYRHARDNYDLEKYGALLEGYYHGFRDIRRWEGRLLSVLDRTVFVMIVWYACQPGIGRTIATGIGFLGVLVLVLLYMTTGSFALLLEDPFASGGRSFGNFPNLRRPDRL
jgi:hypothetical protein